MEVVLYRKRLFRLLGLIVFITSIGGGWLWMAYQQFLQRPLAVELPAEKQILFTIAPGRSLSWVAAQLEAKGYITNRHFFRLLAQWQDQGSAIKAGEYDLTAAMRPQEILQRFVSGHPYQHSITIIEGWRFSEVRAQLASATLLEQQLPAISDSALMQQLGSEYPHPEGLFLPETYQFSAGSSDLALLQRAYQQLQQQLQRLWAARPAETLLKTPYEALILASIIEKESGIEAERPVIAGVFTRRLKLQMRLQTDPTVIYGVGEDFDGNLTRAHLQQDTPYNSYTRAGLPPTPIALVGRAAIAAAISPAPGDALYFVSKGDGSHHFSATLEEHNRAVNRYQRRSQ
ncbi:MAG: endolytic transglycosylase MltG [Gammaproteobacteria bacterium]|nr:endolytic transglycosylase MltG [Gammaproteobacteria bacterium]